MKKSYLFLMSLFCLAGSVFGQYVVQAPQYDGSSTRISGPSAFSTQKYHRAVFLVPQSALGLMSLTNSVITTFGFDMRFGASTQTIAPGNFTVYLENTADNAYNKGTNFTTAISTMTTSFTGTMSIPLTTGGTTMGVTLTTPMTYTGGGIYVAYEWTLPSAADQVGAWTLANSTDLNPGGAVVEGSLPMSTTLTTSNFTPVFRFGAGNNATDIEVTRLNSMGIISKIANAPQIITAEVKNLGAATQTVPVTLTVTGANPFTDTKSVTLASGSSATVSFAPYTPVALGISTIIVTVPTDQNPINDGYGATQSVTCNDMANNPPVAASNFTQNSLGTNGSTGIIISNKYTAPATSSLAAIKLALGNTTVNVGKQVYGVLMDAAGAILSTSSNTITVTNAMLGTFVTFSFNPAWSITGGSDYFLGVGFPTGPMFPVGTAVFDPYVNALGYYVSSLTGGTPGMVNRGSMGIQAVLAYSNTIFSASASQTIVCKQDGPGTVTLTATGGPTTYTWNPGALQGTMVVVTPTVTGANGSIIYNVSGTDPGGSGCKTNVATITVSVSACAGLASNNTNGYDLKLFPNPAVNGKSNITGLTGNNKITVLNTLGQVVLTKQVTEESTEIDLSNLPSGNYLVKITNTESETRVVKVINQN